LSAMTITHGAADGLPAVGDYISEDFLQVLEVICSLKNTVITHLIGASQALRA
jgi:hypothetical protein